MSKISVGILGATGAVGQRFVDFLQGHPWFEISSLAASERSAGKPYHEAVKWRLSSPFPEELGEMEVVSASKPEQVDAKLVFSALPSGIAAGLEDRYADAGFVVASNASANRMKSDVPLMIPEVNASHLSLVDVQKENRARDGFIVTNPNCSTIALTLALRPLVNLDIADVRVATMQAVSGAGFEGVSSMAILDNVIPYISGEENKMETEPLKLLGTLDGEQVKNAGFSISASCHRVPVMDGHTEAVWVQFGQEVSPEEVRDAMVGFEHGLAMLPSLPEKPLLVYDAEDRPQPRLDRDIGRGMTVSVGRIREGIRFVVVGHNTIRGAAGASVLNAELMVQKGMI
ncbi:MAG: aspartate-semialdehyde dehydrogenase [Methermicoccaceae archaeon]